MSIPARATPRPRRGSVIHIELLRLRCARICDAARSFSSAKLRAPARRASDSRSLPHAPHRGGLRDHALGDHRHHVEPLRPLEGPIRPFDRERVLFGAHVALRQPGLELDDGRVRVDVAEDLERFPDLGQALIDHPAAQQELADPGRSSRGGSLVADASRQLDRLAEMRLAGFVAPGGLGRDAGPVQQLHAIGRVGR